MSTKFDFSEPFFPSSGFLPEFGVYQRRVKRRYAPTWQPSFRRAVPPQTYIVVSTPFHTQLQMKLLGAQHPVGGFGYRLSGPCGWIPRTGRQQLMPIAHPQSPFVRRHVVGWGRRGSVVIQVSTELEQLEEGLSSRAMALGRPASSTKKAQRADK